MILFLVEREQSMALRSVDIGAVQDAFQFDDADTWSDGVAMGLRVPIVPSNAQHVVRKEDLGSAIDPLADESYLVVSSTGDLSAERVFAVSNGLKKTDGGANSNFTVEIDATSKPTMAGSTNTDHVDIDADNKALRLGADQDATILYDGTDLQVDPAAVGSGKMTVAANVNTTGSYEVDGTQVVTNQQSAITDSTDNTTGTPASSLVDVTTAGLADPTKVNDNFATLLALVVQYGDALRAHGLIAT